MTTATAPAPNFDHLLRMTDARGTFEHARCSTPRPEHARQQLLGEGQMVGAGQAYIQSVPHLLLFPCLAIALTMLAFTFLGDGLRDALDVRMND